MKIIGNNVRGANWALQVGSRQKFLPQHGQRGRPRDFTVAHSGTSWSRTRTPSYLVLCCSGSDGQPIKGQGLHTDISFSLSIIDLCLFLSLHLNKRTGRPDSTLLVYPFHLTCRCHNSLKERRMVVGMPKWVVAECIKECSLQ